MTSHMGIIGNETDKMFKFTSNMPIKNTLNSYKDF